jgi:hypothetical protein
VLDRVKLNVENREEKALSKHAHPMEIEFAELSPTRAE